jgi:hypothetical protein
MSHTAVILEMAGADPARDRFVRRHGDHTTTIALVGDPATTPAVAQGLIAEGADAVELCGGFGLVPHAAVRAVVGETAAVGAVGFGFESLEGVAAYQATFGTAESLPGGFLVVHPGADPAVDRYTYPDRAAPATFVLVPDAGAAAEVARELAGQGARLFEVYGRPGPEVAVAVLEATDGKVPVGLAAYPG